MPGSREHTAQGRTFLAHLDPLVAAKSFDAALKLEQRAIAWTNPQRKTLNALFKEQDRGGEALMRAFLDARQI